eukprot:8662799-Alexandrium_andersonii.AAC.1
MSLLRQRRCLTTTGLPTACGGCSCAESPLAAAVLEKEVADAAPGCPGRTSGLTKQLAPVRSDFLHGLFFKDVGALPPGNKYSVRGPCNVAHPDAVSYTHLTLPTICSV